MISVFGLAWSKHAGMLQELSSALCDGPGLPIVVELFRVQHNVIESTIGDNMAMVILV